MPTPTLGRIVLLHGRNHNGSVVHPAIITRVWDASIINVTVLPDGCAPYALTSVVLSQEKFINVEELAANATGTIIIPVAYWPPMVASNEAPISSVPRGSVRIDEDAEAQARHSAEFDAKRTKASEGSTKPVVNPSAKKK